MPDPERADGDSPPFRAAEDVKDDTDTADDEDRYVQMPGKWWGAHFENLCEGHRLYILRPNADPDEVIDLHTTPEGEYAGEPVEVTECTLCCKSANEHGQGLHGVSVYGCPNCGGEIESKQSRGRGSVLRYKKCSNCVPDPFLIRVVSAVKRALFG